MFQLRSSFDALANDDANENNSDSLKAVKSVYLAVKFGFQLTEQNPRTMTDHAVTLQ